MPEDLRDYAQAASARAYVPYSGAPAGVVLLLSDGTWAEGVRMENASYPLTVPALQAAWARTRAAGRDDLVAAAASRPFEPGELAFLREATRRDWAPSGSGYAAIAHLTPPAPTRRLDPFLDAPTPASDAEGVALALDASGSAAAVVSAFPVGCVAELEDGRLVAGANVEHAVDWTRGLCAERVALASVLLAGGGPLRKLYLACAHAPGATPCGGCRQVLAEQAPGVPLVIWQGDAPPLTVTPESLLPSAFGGAGLRLTGEALRGPGTRG